MYRKPLSNLLHSLKTLLKPSSVVANMKYDVDRAILRVVFMSGNIYDYKGVPEELFEKMKAADSKGTFLNKVIKGKFDFERVV